MLSDKGCYGKSRTCASSISHMTNVAKLFKLEYINVTYARRTMQLIEIKMTMYANSLKITLHTF